MLPWISEGNDFTKALKQLKRSDKEPNRDREEEELRYRKNEFSGSTPCDSSTLRCTYLCLRVFRPWYLSAASSRNVRGKMMILPRPSNPCP